MRRLSAIWLHVEPIDVRRMTYREVERQGEVPAVSLFKGASGLCEQVNVRTL